MGFGMGFTLYCHQTWLAGKSTIKMDDLWMIFNDFRLETPMFSGFPIATLDDTGG